MFPFCDSPSSMDIPLYQQLQLSPPSSPKPPDGHQSLFYYHSSPPFAADAFHHAYLGAATPPSGDQVDSPEEVLVMDQPPAPSVVDAGNAQALGGGMEREAAAAAAARKDRHSKICTAGGMRDRRMRLSLDVARKFFALQDMLGFDKASKTVQWLLSMSKGAIREVMTDEASSDCEEDGSSSLSVVDGKHRPPAAEAGGGDHNVDRSEGKKPARARKATNNPKPPRKSANAHPIPDKESRAKARERARERTKEKNRMRWVTLASTINLEAARDELIITTPINNLNRSSTSSSMNIASASELEERCSSSTNGRAVRMQETSMASDASDLIMGFGNGVGGYGGSSYYQHQVQEQQWELGGVVFANSRLY